MTLTHHSEYGQIKTVYLNHVSSAFNSQDRISAQWHKLNYLGEPNYETALKEYRQFENIIRSAGADIKYFDSDNSLTIDSLYCRDSSLPTDYGIILCSMGKEGRIPEPRSAESIFRTHGEKILGKIEPPGKVEGGDVCWLDETTLAVGHSYRTNMEGIDQLRRLLEPKGISVIKVDLPHYKGPSDVFHLMSILSPVDKKLMVVYPPLMPVSFRNLLIEKDYGFVEVPDQEFESMGCNVLAVAPGRCVMVRGNPVTQKRLEEAGATVTTYQGDEISVKGGGGPTCLTRPLVREI